MENKVRLSKRVRPGHEMTSEDAAIEALWARFYESIHKGQKGSNHPVETLQAMSVALSALGEGIHQMLKRLADK